MTAWSASGASLLNDLVFSYGSHSLWSLALERSYDSLFSFLPFLPPFSIFLFLFFWGHVRFVLSFVEGEKFVEKIPRVEDTEVAKDWEAKVLTSESTRRSQKAGADVSEPVRLPSVLIPPRQSAIVPQRPRW
jgi:hypothetical protein